jgi:hypothetical protein
LRNDPTDIYATPIVSLQDVKPTIADKAHELLMLLCTIPRVGICFPDAGWYVRSAGGKNDETRVKVFNPVLLRLLGGLNPMLDPKQRELVIGILEACPELVHSYVYWKTNE